MTPSLRTDSVYILRRVNYRDNDLILTLLGRDSGQFSARVPGGRSSRKRCGGALGLFQRLEMVITGEGTRTRVVEASVERDLPKIERSYEKIVVASYATDIVRSLVKAEGESTAIFTALDRFYEKTSEAPVDLHLLELQLDRFLLELLAHWGTLPALDRCHRCGLMQEKMDKYRFMRTGEGLICASCRREGDVLGVVDPTTYQMLRFLAGGEPLDAATLADPTALGQVRRLIEASLMPNLGQQLQTRTAWLAILENAPTHINSANWC